MKNMYHVFFALFVASATFAAQAYNISVVPEDGKELLLKDGDVISGTIDGTERKVGILVAKDAKITLENAQVLGVNEGQFMSAGIRCLGNCTLDLRGENIMKGYYGNFPGVQVPDDIEGQKYTMTIEGDGSLEASSNGYGAGIGCNRYTNCGHIVIKSGVIKATGGFTAAGIGSSKDATSGNIVIEGGEITAAGGLYAAGIGGAFSEESYKTCGDITISGGKVTATGGQYAAGIGSGDLGTCGDITISGGKVAATGGNNAAGIGSGEDGKSGDITIGGGNITATGGDGGAGIGGGVEASSGDVTISGGTVTATGGAWAAGIGVGYAGHVEAITINGGEVAAIGGNNGAGIGVGFEGACGNITITNDVTKVVAVKGAGAPYSIGGYDDETGSIDIGGKTKSPIEKGFFIFPAPPAKLVDFETVGGKTYAIVDGDYSGEGALNIATDENVDKVIFERTFPVVDGDNNYSTIMFPFEIKANEVGNVERVFSFLGIDVDEQNRKYVAVERVWCNDDSKDECNYSTGKFEAYKPYLIQLESGETSISINNTSPLVLKATPTDLSAYDVVQNGEYNKVGNYVFRGVVQGKTWGAEDDDVLGTDGAAAYGFAGTATSDISVGQFVKVGEGASIKPFRGYIYKNPVPKKVKSNGGDFVHQTASIDNDIPETMNVVVVDRKKDGEEQTTVIGQFNSRTGEFRMNRTMRTYDLKGRSVRDASHMAKGVYLKK